MTENRVRKNSGRKARQRRARQQRARRILMTVCLLALVMVVSVGATIAWLTDTTDPVTNTFTVGNIDITLAETTTDYKMVPGNTIAKDPKVTVEAGSEACWLFVKVEKSANLDAFITYTVDSGWTALSGVTGVYYRSVDASTTDQAFSVLTNDRVTVKDSVTKTMMDGLKATNATQPTLTFTAYACQKDNVADAAAAWAKITSPAT